jgi:uncharacterized protein (UPF0276 family)
MNNNDKPDYLGFGLGLRAPHYLPILSDKPNVDWFEIISDNYIDCGGKPLYFLDKIRENYPIVMHGVAMSIGSTESLNTDYLKSIKKLSDRIQPAWISDHLCWTGVHGRNTHDLLPLPYTQETIDHVSSRIQQAQEILGRRLLIENVSSYCSYTDSCMTEWEFISEICKQSGCLLLMDINNIYVSSFNHHFDPKAYIDGIPLEHVQQIHLAGHQNHGDYIIDTHDADIVEEVWDLYRYILTQTGPISTMIERDDNIPPLIDLLHELNKARMLFTDHISAQSLKADHALSR